MSARQGQTNPLAGPRLPKIGPQILGPRPDEEPFSPTNGSCFGCGEKVGVMEFGLLRRGRVVGLWRLCAACYEWGTGSERVLNPDPLTVGQE